MTLGDIVFLKVASERCAGMVTGIIQRQSGLLYLVTWEDGEEHPHYAIELTDTFVPEYAQEE